MLPGFNAFNLFVGKAEVYQLESILAIRTQFHDETRGCTLRRGRRVIQFMREVTGELAEGVELFGLLLDACYLSDAIEERGHHPLLHGWNGSQHLRELFFS